MKEEKKKIKSSQVSEADEYSKYIEELAQSITEGMREQRLESLEPFEVYAERIKSKLFADPDQFHSRFVEGYQSLLDELSKGQGTIGT